MSERSVIVFVDDDQDVLSGMKNMMFRDRARWDMVFLCGGPTAIDYLNMHPFDVVVSDMRMPEMDGEAVMAAARLVSPHAGRIVLSGYADGEARARLVPLVDQWLGKPCGVVELRAAIEKALARRAAAIAPEPT